MRSPRTASTTSTSARAPVRATTSMAWRAGSDNRETRDRTASRTVAGTRDVPAESTSVTKNAFPPVTR